MSVETEQVRWPSDQTSGFAWVEQDGRFSGIEDADGFRPFESLDLEHLKPTCRSRGVCNEVNCPGPVFPADFKFCPNCRADLVPQFGADDTVWSFPGPDGDGLPRAKSLEIMKVSDLMDGAVPCPEADDLTLIVAGNPRRLLAIARSNSVVYAFNRQTKRWTDLQSPLDFDVELPRWSWSVCAFEAGFAVAGVDRPAVVSLNALGTKLEAVSPPEGTGRATAGPGSLDGRVLFLVAHPNASLSVIAFEPRSRTWSTPTPVSSERVLAELIFAAPVSKSPALYWPGRSGYIAVRSVQGNLEATFRPWPAEFCPELQVRPIWCEQNFWQFGQTSDLQFQKLSLKSPPASATVEATHLTAGECSFTSGMKRYVIPWDENRYITVGNGDSFLTPICGLKGLSALVADCGFDPASRRLNPSELLQPNASERPARLQLQRESGSPTYLGRVIRLSDFGQLQSIVYDGLLLIYDNKRGAIDVWKYQ